ncbi:hypothetical protein QEW_1926 [Clostridioides difficile CD160]|nr:hypothetical protein QEW_1926 [Clostridioides difficile CD160]
MNIFTKLGKTLEPVFKSLCEWSTQYLYKLKKNGNKQLKGHVSK